MNLAKISSNGQITVPVEIRRLLSLKSSDKILLLQKQNGEIVISMPPPRQSAKHSLPFPVSLRNWVPIMNIIFRHFFCFDLSPVKVRNIAELRDILNRKAHKYLPDGLIA